MAVSYDRERLGSTLSLQWDPANSTRISLDTLYAQFNQERTEEFLEVISFAREGTASGFRAVDLVSDVVDDNRNLVSATFNDVDIRSEQRIDLLETEFIQSSLEIEQDFNDRLSMRFLGGISRAMGATRNRPRSRSSAMMWTAIHTIIRTRTSPSSITGSTAPTRPAGSIALQQRWVTHL